MMKRNSLHFILFLFIFVFFSCSESEIHQKETSGDETVSQDPYFTDDIEAFQLASTIKPRHSTTKALDQEIPSKKVKDLIAAPDEME